jgi:hypothetical protein
LNGFNITGVDVNNGAYPLPPSPFSDIPVSPIHPIIRNIYAGSCIIHAITGRPMVPWTVSWEASGCRAVSWRSGTHTGAECIYRC